MTFTNRLVKASLKKKGFSTNEKGKHVKFTYFTLRGEKTPIITAISHGASGKGISSRMVSEMARQCQVSKDTFKAFIECTIEQEEYEEILVDSGILQIGHNGCSA